MLKYICTFDVEERSGLRAIEVTYWFNDEGRVIGEAYFLGHDFTAPIVDGHFEHPMLGDQYRVHTAGRLGNGRVQEARLEVNVWRTVGRGKVSMEEVVRS